MLEGEKSLIEEKESPIRQVSKDIAEYLTTDHVQDIFEKVKKTPCYEKKLDINGAKDVSDSSYYVFKDYLFLREVTIDGPVRLGGEKFYKLSAWGDKELYEEIQKEEYYEQLRQIENLIPQTNIDDIVRFVNNIDDMIVTVPMSERKTMNGKNGDMLGFYSFLENKIYVLEGASKLTLVHEIMHCLVHNFPILRSMLNINQDQILSLPTILYEKERSNLEKDIANLEKDIADFEKDIADFEKDIANLEKDIANLEKDIADFEKGIANLEKDIADAYLQIESLKKAYILTTDIESTIQKSIQQNKKIKDILIKYKGTTEKLLNNLIKQKDITTEQKDITTEQKDITTEQKDITTEQKDIMTKQLKKKSYILSIDEIHVRFFEFRYACQLYLKPPVKMGDKITIEHINQLLDNTEYWKDAGETYKILDYVKNINSLIEKEHAKPDDQRNIDLLLELQTEKSKILEWILNTSNDILVSGGEAQSTLQENSAQSS